MIDRYGRQSEIRFTRDDGLELPRGQRERSNRRICIALLDRGDRSVRFIERVDRLLDQGGAFIGEL